MDELAKLGVIGEDGIGLRQGDIGGITGIRELEAEAMGGPEVMGGGG